MSSLIVSAGVTSFWLIMGLLFLVLDFMGVGLRLYVLGREISPSWVCFLFALLSGVRLFSHWNAYQANLRRRVAEELQRRQSAARRRERTEPPDPNFQFTETPPPTDPPTDPHRPLPNE
jgi:hypothetical protein